MRGADPGRAGTTVIELVQMVFADDALPHIGIKLSAIEAAGLALAANEGRHRRNAPRRRAWRRSRTNLRRPGARSRIARPGSCRYRPSHFDHCSRPSM